MHRRAQARAATGNGPVFATPHESPSLGSHDRVAAVGRTSVTSRAIAEIAGVSQPTVVRVVNAFPFVKPSTRERVLRAME